MKTQNENHNKPHVAVSAAEPIISRETIAEEQKAVNEDKTKSNEPTQGLVEEQSKKPLDEKKALTMTKDQISQIASVEAVIQVQENIIKWLKDNNEGDKYSPAVAHAETVLHKIKELK